LKKIYKNNCRPVSTAISAKKTIGVHPFNIWLLISTFKNCSNVYYHFSFDLYCASEDDCNTCGEKNATKISCEKIAQMALSGLQGVGHPGLPNSHRGHGTRKLC